MRAPRTSDATIRSRGSPVKKSTAASRLQLISRTPNQLPQALRYLDPATATPPRSSECPTRQAPELPRPTRRPMQSSRVGSALAASRKPDDKGTVARSGPKKRPTNTPAIPHRSKKVRARGNIVGYRESSGAESAFQMLQLLMTSRYRPVRTICAKPLIAIPESLDSPNSFNYTPIRTGASTQPGRQSGVRFEGGRGRLRNGARQERHQFGSAVAARFPRTCRQRLA